MEKDRWNQFSVQTTTRTEYRLRSLMSDECLVIPKIDKDKIRRPTKILLDSNNKFNAKGIINIGNTCYMSSVLQALVNTPLLGKFFAEDAFLKDVNEFNINGTKGLMTTEVSHIIKHLKDTTDSPYNIKVFYKELCKIYRQFDGNTQQDSHEFLTILLDVLHEDLNRKTSSKSPLNATISLDNPDQKTEMSSSKEQWKNIQGSIGSVISDFCGGQTRTQISCESCGNFKVIFETFMDISVPVPAVQGDAVFTIVFVPRGSSNIKKLGFSMDSEIKIADLYSQIERYTGISYNNLVFAHVKSSVIEKMLGPPEILIDILPVSDEKIYLYEIISTVIDGESDGKPTLPTIKEFIIPELATGDYIDVFYKGQWVMGKIKKIIGIQLVVRTYDKKARKIIVKADPHFIAPFREHSSSTNKILTIPVTMARELKTSVRFFGVPLMLSIGDWYTTKFLIKYLIKQCLLYTDQLYENLDRKEDFIIFVLWHSTKTCALCKNSICNGCPLSSQHTMLSVLFSDSPSVFLCIYWNNPYEYRYPFPDKTYITEDLDIYTCLDEYKKKETIEMECSNCGSPTMLGSTQIWRVPDILIVHFKRFFYRDSRMHKIGNLVTFPLNNLDISDVMNLHDAKNGITIETARENYLYELYAVVNHKGSAERGHYTSFCLFDGLKGFEWLLYDDERVFKLAGDVTNEVVSDKAYILFYRRRRFASINAINLMFC